MANAHESALVVLVPEADKIAGPCRNLYDPSAALGVPAHITVLYPFKAPDAITTGDLDVLRAVFVVHSPFDFELAELRRFPDVLYLAPEPARPFLALTAAVAARFPETPPYRGAYDEVVPHLTLAQVEDDARLARIEATFRRRCGGKLPIHAIAKEVVLMDDSFGLWRVRETFPLTGQPQGGTRT